MRIELLRADISSIKVDAIVDASPKQHVDGVGNVPVGSAVITPGGNLLCKFVIHAIGPRPGDKDGESKLRSATLSALERAEELAIGSVAFSSSRKGIFGFPSHRCAEIMIGAAVEFRQRVRSLQRVVFCLFGAESYADFERVLRELDK
jgi:O-acetyl-ADP-ribose deacetylase (regulator of RNase III)